MRNSQSIKPLFWFVFYIAIVCLFLSAGYVFVYGDIQYELTGQGEAIPLELEFPPTPTPPPSPTPIPTPTPTPTLPTPTPPTPTPPPTPPREFIETEKPTPLPPRYPFEIGLSGGVNVNTVTDNDASYIAKPYFNLLFEWHFIDYLSVGLGIGHNLKAFDYSQSTGGIDGTGTNGVIRMQYLQIPIYLSARYPFETWSPFLTIGLNNSILLSGEAFDQINDHFYDASDMLAPYYLGVLFGIGVDINVWKGYITTGFYYDLGVLNAVTGGPSNPLFSQLQSGYAYDMMIVVGYKIGLDVLFGYED